MHHKSDVEIPWDAFVNAFEPVLKRTSGSFRRQYQRDLALGSATRINTPAGDAVRFPIAVRGGEREYAVATVLVTGELKSRYDPHKLEMIARAATDEAEKYPTTPPEKPGSLHLTYP